MVLSLIFTHLNFSIVYDLLNIAEDQMRNVHKMYVYVLNEWVKVTMNLTYNKVKEYRAKRRPHATKV